MVHSLRRVKSKTRDTPSQIHHQIQNRRHWAGLKLVRHREYNGRCRHDGMGCDLLPKNAATVLCLCGRSAPRVGNALSTEPDDRRDRQSQRTAQTYATYSEVHVRVKPLGVLWPQSPESIKAGEQYLVSFHRQRSQPPLTIPISLTTRHAVCQEHHLPCFLGYGYDDRTRKRIARVGSAC